MTAGGHGQQPLATRAVRSPRASSTRVGGHGACRATLRPFVTTPPVTTDQPGHAQNSPDRSSGLHWMTGGRRSTHRGSLTGDRNDDRIRPLVVRGQPYGCVVTDHPVEVHFGVRPARVAVVTRAEEGWEHSALRVLEVLSTTWGGAGGIIVSCDDDGLSQEQLWSAIELYDPDVWAAHVRTYRGHRIRDPESYDRVLDDVTDQSLRQHGGDRDERRFQLHDILMSEPLSDWVPPEPFWERTRKYLAPSWDRDYGHAELVRDDELPTGPLVDATQLSPLPDRILAPRVDDLPLAARVLIASKWGALGPSARARLQDRGVAVHDVPIVENDLKSVLSACWGGQFWPTNEIRHAIADALGPASASQSQSYDVHALDERGPFALSMMGLSEFGRPLPMRHEWPLVVVVGDSADDFALAMALDRCLRPALWVPPSVLGPKTMQVVAGALATMRHDRKRKIHLTSCSLDEAALTPLVSDLTGSFLTSAEVVVSLPEPLPRDRPLAVLDAQRGSAREDEHFVGGTTGRGIRARLPSAVRADDPFRLSWWNDVVRVDHRLPTRWALNEHIVARSSAWRTRARVTRDGLAFHSHPEGLLLSGVPLEQLVDNPRLRFLDAKAVFDVLASEAGITLVESSAGRFTARATELWGGLPALTTDLQRPLVRRVLAAYLSEKPSGVDPGNYIANRRHLSLEDLGAVVDASGELTEFADWCLRTGVLRRGLSLACDHCSAFGWYDADDVGQAFRCWRCRTETVIDSQVVRGEGPEPRWYYALAEVVYQACKHNFNVPVLALHKLAAGARSVLGMTDHQVLFPRDDHAESSDHDEVEIDLWGIIDGRIILGEAKTSNQLEATAPKRTEKVRELKRAAEALTADTLVLATAASSWAPSSIDAIKKAFAGARCDVELLTDVDPYLAALRNSG
jgi:hypothetical protein